MQIYKIAKCKIFDEGFIILSDTSDEKLSALGIEASVQIKHSDIHEMKEIGQKRGWVRIPSHEASIVQKVVGSGLTAGAGILIGSLFGPVGMIAGGLLGLKTGLSLLGGVGRQASIIAISKDQKNMYIGSVPFHQFIKMQAILNPNIEDIGIFRCALSKVCQPLKTLWYRIKPLFI